jgi:hypothetical protein
LIETQLARHALEPEPEAAAAPRGQAAPGAEGRAAFRAVARRSLAALTACGALLKRAAVRREA